LQVFRFFPSHLILFCRGRGSEGDKNQDPKCATTCVMICIINVLTKNGRSVVDGGNRKKHLLIKLTCNMGYTCIQYTSY
jgi:hypothetical protein